MLNFEFHNPTRIVFGQGEVADLARLVPAQARVLVLYGGESARRTGTLDEVRAALGERSVSEFGGIEPNPSYETLMRAVEQVRAEHIDYLLAVGGGSVIDGTKFVAAAACFDGEPWDILLQRGRNVSLTWSWRLSAGTRVYVGASDARSGIGATQRTREAFVKLQADLDDARSAWSARGSGS